MILGASLVVVTASTAHALIGETESQLTKRYGDSLGDIPTEAFGSVRGFMATGYVVGIAIIDGVSSMEMFSKNNRSEMTPTEIETLLKANGPGDWISESISKPNWKRWRRVDDTLVGLYDAKRHFLYISSKPFYDAQGAKLEKTIPYRIASSRPSRRLTTRSSEQLPRATRLAAPGVAHLCLVR